MSFEAQTKEKQEVTLWKRLLFSQALADKTIAKKIAYLGVIAVQFSLTIVSSVLAGIMVGPLFGFLAVFLGDGIGYAVNSMGYPYYWWVALSCATMALIAGLVMYLPLRFKGSVYVKLAIICAATLLICSVGINSAGMYYIGLKLYMPKNVLAAFEERFGGRQTYGIYLVIRFFILGQIWNSLANYALLFAVVPLLKAIKPLKLDLN